MDNEVMKAFMAHAWKGEVRELQNVIERAVIFAEGPMLTKQELPAPVRTDGRRRCTRLTLGDR